MTTCCPPTHRPELLGDVFDEMLIVGHKQNSALEAVERMNQRLDGFEIQMIRRLIHNNQVRLLPGEESERYSRALTSRQCGDFLLDEVGIESKSAHHAANLVLLRVREARLEEIQRIFRQIKLIDVVLGEEHVTRMLVHAADTERRLEFLTNQLDESRFS